MENPQIPSITSFVIRFVQEPPPAGGPAYRGTIHHVQTNQEISFIRWQDAVEFIQRFISLEAEGGSPQESSPPKIES